MNTHLRTLRLLSPAVAILAMLGCDVPDGNGDSNGNGNGDDDVEMVGDCVLVQMGSAGGAWSGCYVVDGWVRVVGDLSIEAGTEVSFREGAGLELSAGFVVNGTEDEPVLFNGTEAGAGHWRGLRVRGDSNSNTLTHAIISGAGSEPIVSGDAAAALWIDGRLSIEDTTIEETDGVGLVSLGGLRGLSGTTITGNAWAASVDFDSVSELGGDNSFAGNEDDVVYIIDGRSGDEVTIPKIDAIYEAGELEARADLTIEAGVEIAFLERGRLEITEGVFRVEGTQDDPVVFRGVEASPGWWDGLSVRTDRSNNRIDWLELSHAGRDNIGSWTEPAGLIVGAAGSGNVATISVHNSSFFDNDGYGLYIYAESLASTTLLGFSNNHFEGNTGPAAKIAPAHMNAVEGSNSATGNGMDVIEVADGRYESNSTWRNMGIPWFIAETVSIEDGTTTIEPGTEIRFFDGANLRVRGARLLAEGTPTEHILMVGSEPQAGWWVGVQVARSSGGNSVFSHVEVRHAGKSAQHNWLDPAGITVGAPASADAADVLVNDCIISDIGVPTESTAYGIQVCTSTSSPNCSGSTINPDVCTANTFSNINGANCDI